MKIKIISFNFKIMGLGRVIFLEQMEVNLGNSYLCIVSLHGDTINLFRLLMNLREYIMSQLPFECIQFREFFLNNRIYKFYTECLYGKCINDTNIHTYMFMY